MLQKLRGSTMPGYISLFQRTDINASKRIISDTSDGQEQDLEDEFNEIFDSIEARKQPKNYRKRNVKTV